MHFTSSNCLCRLPFIDCSVLAMIGQWQTVVVGHLNVPIIAIVAKLRASASVELGQARAQSYLSSPICYPPTFPMHLLSLYYAYEYCIVHCVLFIVVDVRFFLLFTFVVCEPSFGNGQCPYL